MTCVHTWALTVAGNERRRAATLTDPVLRADAKGWCRDLVASARKRRLENVGAGA